MQHPSLIRFLLGILIPLLMASAPREADAAPSAAVQARARRLVRAGQKAMRQKRWADALRRFKVAYHLWKRKEIQFNIALVYQEMGNTLSAAKHLRIYLAAAGPGARRKLPSRFKRLLKSVSVLRIHAGRSDADIFVDGTLVGTGRAEAVLHPGRHRASVRLGGAVRARTTVVLSRGQVSDWRPSLAPVDVRRRTGPSRRTVGGGTESPSRTPTWRSLHWGYFAATAGVAVAAAVALTVTGLETNALEREFQTAPTPDLQTRGRTYLAVTHALTGVTLAAGVTAAVLAIFTRWRTERQQSPRLTVLPGVSRSGASLVLHWPPGSH